MIGNIFVTSSGYDPEKGKDVKDPYFGEEPVAGCLPPGHSREATEGRPRLFSWFLGRCRNVNQFVIGGLGSNEKIAQSKPSASSLSSV